MSKAKRTSLVLLSAAGLLILLLAMSLPSLHLSSGTPFSLGKSDVSLPGVAGTFPGGEMIAWMFRGLLALALIGMPVYIIVSLLSAEGRRQLVANLIILLTLIAIAIYLDRNPLTEGEQGAEMAIGSGEEMLDEVPETPPSAFDESEPPAWLAIALILVASGIGVGLLAAGLWILRQRIDRSQASLHPLARAAQQTLDSLQSGGNFATAITRCYYEMNRIVKEQRGISREATMTPREFEAYLTGQGLPRGAVETLTRLFEQVRYGSVIPGSGDESLALASLTEIVAACQPLKGGPGES